MSVATIISLKNRTENFNFHLTVNQSDCESILHNSDSIARVSRGLRSRYRSQYGPIASTHMCIINNKNIKLSDARGTMKKKKKTHCKVRNCRNHVEISTFFFFSSVKPHVPTTLSISEARN